MGAMSNLGVESVSDLQHGAFDREVRGALMRELEGGGGMKLLHRKKLEKALADIQRGARAEDGAAAGHAKEEIILSSNVARITSEMAKAREELREWHGLYKEGVSTGIHASRTKFLRIVVVLRFEPPPCPFFSCVACCAGAVS